VRKVLLQQSVMMWSVFNWQMEGSKVGFGGHTNKHGA
jgi:hypothetical protein